MTNKKDQEQPEDWAPPWSIHGPVWLLAVIAMIWGYREVSWWAGILIFLGIMLVWGLVIAGVQTMKREQAAQQHGLDDEAPTDIAQLRDQLLEQDPDLRAAYELVQEQQEKA